MSEPGLGERLRSFLYGTPHLVGSAAALAGLALYLGGVIDAGWWAIAAGLYAGGYLVAVAVSSGGGTVAATLDEARLQHELQRLIGSARSRLPAEAQTLLDSIGERARTLIPVLDDLAGRGVIGDKVRHDVLSGVTRYLPDTLSRYLALPAAYLKLHQGKTNNPSRLLTDQLRLIDQHLARCLEDAFGEHAAELTVHGRFLADKTGRTDLP